MRPASEIFNGLVKAPDLEAAVYLLSDDELRQVRGALSRKEFSAWPADTVHGVCIIEGCRRFEYPGKEAGGNVPPLPVDYGHGSEVGL